MHRRIGFHNARPGSIWSPGDLPFTLADSERSRLTFRLALRPSDPGPGS